MTHAFRITNLSTVSILALLINTSAVTPEALAATNAPLENVTKNSALFLTPATKTENTFVDENGNELQNIITKYNVRNVYKFYDIANNRLIDPAEKVEGQKYTAVKFTLPEENYVSAALAKTQYGTGPMQKLFVWSKNTLGGYELNTAEDASAPAIVFNYTDENSSPRLENPTGNIDQNFINNSIATTSQPNSGAAIYNKDNNVGKIHSNFVNNTMPAPTPSYGGALYNENGTIEEITGSFVNNTIEKSGSSNGFGAAIYNTKAAEISSINSNFIGNKIISKNGTTNGGAIFNGAYKSGDKGGVIGDITGDFIGNGVKNSGAASNPFGGAIFNNQKSTINSITGNFIGNYAIHTGTFSALPRGGAVNNDNSTITGDINGDFIGNFVFSEKGTGDGGAIYNSSASIGNINGDFIGNYVHSKTADNGHSSYGGAIYNYKGTIKDITGDFIANHIDIASSYAQGGAIANYSSPAVINSINGNFFDNYVQAQNYAYGGAFYNSLATVTESLSGTFVNNSAKAGTSNGGAISNNYGGKLTIKNSSFYNNHADATTGTALGGAIYSQYDLKIIADNGKSNVFSGNYTNQNGTIDDNAIYLKGYNDWKGDNQDHLPVLTLEANQNSNITFWDNINGVNGYQVNISGDGTGSVSLYNDIKNGDISIDKATLDLANGIIRDYEIKSLTSTDQAKYNIDISFADQKSDKLIIADPVATAGNTLKLNILNFIDQYQGQPVQVQVIKSANNNIQLALPDNIIYKAHIGNTVFNNTLVEEAGAVKLVTKDTTNDSIEISGAVYDTLDAINTFEHPEERNFIFQTADTYHASKDLSETAAGTLNLKGLDGSLSVIDGNSHSLFKLNNETTLNLDHIKIEKATSVISGTEANAVVNISNSEIRNNSEGISFAGSLNVLGNTTIAENGNGINLTADTAKLSLNAENGAITVNDKILGATGSNLYMENGDINLHQKISGTDVHIENANVKLYADDILNGLNVHAGRNAMLDIANGQINRMTFKNLQLNNNLNLAVDVDLAAQTMDNISADSFAVAEDIRLRASAPDYKINVSRMNLLSDTEEDLTSILFADETLKNNVTTSVSEVAYSPVYKYDVAYDKQNGHFLFTRKKSDSFNPAVLAAPVAAQAGGYLTQLHSYDEAFADMDMYMSNFQKERRKSVLRMACYCPSGMVSYYRGPQKICNGNKVWIRPYATFEDVSLKRGPKVSNTAYGTYIGEESGIYDLSHGWIGMLGAYFGYNGSHQEYDDIDIRQNGATLGLVGMVYKNNYFAGLTINAGASHVEADTRYGDESFMLWRSGIAAKTGYNIEFNNNFVVQPNLLMSYSFINTEEYTNAAGAKIANDNLHSVQIEPGVKFIANLNNGWMPYASLSFVETLNNKTKFKANDIELPELSVKPFVKYGLGVRKKWNNHLDGYAQTNLTSGGRKGADIQLNIRWMF